MLRNIQHLLLLKLSEVRVVLTRGRLWVSRRRFLVLSLSEELLVANIIHPHFVE